MPQNESQSQLQPFKTSESDIKGLLWNIKSHLDRGSEIVQGLQVVSSQGSHELVFVLQPYNLFMNNVWMDGIALSFYFSLSFLGLLRGTDWQSVSISQNFLQLKEIRFLVELFRPRTGPLSSLPGVHKYSPTPSVTERLNTHTGVTQLWSLVQKYSPTQIIKSKGFKIFQSHSVFIRKIFLDTNILCSCFPPSFVRNYLQSCTAVCNTIGARGVCTRRGDSLHTFLLLCSPCTAVAPFAELVPSDLAL